MVDKEKAAKLLLKLMGDDFCDETLQKWHTTARSKWSKGQYSPDDLLLAERILRKYPAYVEALGMYALQPTIQARLNYQILDYVQEKAAFILVIEAAKHGGKNHGLDPLTIHEYAKVQREVHRPLLPTGMDNPVPKGIWRALCAQAQELWAKHSKEGDAFLVRLRAAVAATAVTAVHDEKARDSATVAKPTDEPLTNRKSHDRNTGKAGLRHWTQPDLDNAIRQYQSQRAAAYADLRQGIKKGKAGARKDAKKLFGRNVIARKLGVRGPSMVSRSEAWIAIAEELHIPLARNKLKGARHTTKTGRIGHEIALEAQSQNPTGEDDNKPSDAPLLQAERDKTLREIRRLAEYPKKKMKEEAGALLAKYDAGEITDEQVRQTVTTLLVPAE